MNVLRVHVENETFVLSKDCLKKIEGSRLEKAVFQKTVYPNILVQTDSDLITNIYLNTTLKCWNTVWELVRDNFEDVEYFTEKLLIQESTDLDNNYIEISDELLARFENDGDESDDENLKELESHLLSLTQLNNDNGDNSCQEVINALSSDSTVNSIIKKHQFDQIDSESSVESLDLELGEVGLPKEPGLNNDQLGHHELNHNSTTALL